MSFEATDIEIDPIHNIKGLIKGYDRGSIIKEYIQNAADAGANELVITFDRRCHDNLKGTIFEGVMGPSLLIRNNSVFSAHDFESIKNTYSMGKAENAGATGQFGQGFNCSFSVSDDPSFISSGEAWWFDVHKAGIGKRHGKTIGRWKSIADQEIQQWLKSFRIPEYDINNGTTFRLPLRSESTARNSKISNDIFLFADFYKWVKEWRNNAQNLLFIRNIRKLILQEITENGELIRHLEIETINSEEIDSINAEIQAGFEGKKPKEICENWLRTNTQLKHHYYKHQFLTSYLDSQSGQLVENVEIWAVVNGLFNGPNNSLIKQALRIIDSGAQAQKVLPWAGVATLIDSDDDKLKKSPRKLFTFLPLSSNSDYSVHIHGWFDVDSKRTDIERTSKEGTALEALLTWNKLLMRDAVGVAWANLLNKVKQELTLSDYFSLWPTKESNDSFNKSILEGFYLAISQFESIYCCFQDGDAWRTPSNKIYYLKQSNDSLLFKALNQGFELAKGRINETIRKHLEDVNAGLTVINADEVLSYIDRECKEINYPVLPNKIGIPILANQDWLVAVAEFCAGDNKNYSNLDGLPFSLAHNGYVYESSHDLLLDGDIEQVNLLCEFSELKIHESLLAVIGNASELPINWHFASFKNMLSIISSHFEKFERNDDWLQALVSYISNASASDIKKSEQVLNTLDIIQQEDGGWGAPFTHVSDYGPILASNEEEYPKLFKLNFNLVKKDKISLYRMLNNHEQLVKELSSDVFIQHILLNIEAEFCEDDELRHYVLDFISNNINWIESLGIKELAKLKSIPFIVTESGHKLTLNSDRPFYIGGGFNTPENISDLNGVYELVLRPSANYRKMLKKLGVKEQTAFNYVSDIILPFLEDDKPSLNKIQVLFWLVTEWERIKLACSTDEKVELVRLLSEAEIVPCVTEGMWKQAKKVYLPSFQETLPRVLQTNDTKPQVLKKIDSKWELFLSEMGASSTLLAPHVNRTVGVLIEKQDKQGAIDFWNYVIENFELFVTLPFGSRKLIDNLLELPCFPVAKPRGIIKPDGVEPVLCKSNKLILKGDLPILGGIYFALHNSVKLEPTKGQENLTKDKIVSFLRFIKKPALNDVYENFRRLTKVEILDKSLEAKVVSNAKEFYRFIGRTEQTIIPNDIKQMSVRIGGMWIDSYHVFKTKVKVSGIYHWGALLSENEDTTLKKGLNCLGVKDKPTSAYMASLLANEKKYPLKKKLTEVELFEACEILNLLNYEIELDECPSFPLLSEENVLVASNKLFIKDLEIYNKSEVKNIDLDFVSEGYEELAGRLCIPGIRDGLYGCLNNEQSILAKKNEFFDCLEVEKYIRNEYFIDGLIRIISDQQDFTDIDVESYDKATLIPAEFRYFSTLLVDFYNGDTWIYTDNDASNLADLDASLLNLKAQDSSEDMIDELTLFICDRARLDSNGQTYVSRMLRNQMDQDQIQQFLDKKNIKALPTAYDRAPVSTIFEDYYEDINVFHQKDSDLQEYTGVQDEKSDEVDDEFPVSKSSLEVKDSKSASLESSDNSPHVSVEDRGVLNPSSAHANAKRPILSLNKTKSSANGSKIANSGVEIPPPTNVKKNANSHILDKEDGRQSTKRNGANTYHNDGDITPIEENFNGTNSRYPAYVSPNEEMSESDSKSKSTKAIEIGNKGEDFVLKEAANLVLSKQNKLQKARTNQKGYDITEISSEGEIVRYIEVKTLTSKWGLGGVAISPSQLEFATEHENWWLFVVEDINEQVDITLIHQFQNPVRKISEFRFDNSWKPLANSGLDIKTSAIDSKGERPQVGEVFLIPSSDFLIEVLEVFPRGELTMVSAKNLDTGSIRKLKFKPDWEIV
jgi:hypothetical protein